MNPSLKNTLKLAAAAVLSPLIAGATPPAPPGEEVNFTVSITQTEIANGAVPLDQIIQQGMQVFSTPFNIHDGLGDGPINPENKQDPGGRPSLQANPTAGNGHFLRINGLDSQTCVECHFVHSNANIPATFEVGGVGGSAANAFPLGMTVDPFDKQGKNLATFDGRIINPPFIFGSGGIELLAKEMTADLQKIKNEAKGSPETWYELTTHGIDFGSIRWLIKKPPEFDEAMKIQQKSPPQHNCNSQAPSQDTHEVHAGSDMMRFIGIVEAAPEWSKYRGKVLKMDTSKVVGVSSDLVVRPFGRKGNNVTTRDFDCGAIRFHQGMEPIEIVGEDIDNDGDGVINEVTVGEMSALSIFNTTTLPPCQASDEGNGAEIFAQVGCASCHVPVINTSRKKLPYQFPEVANKPFDVATTYYEVDLSAAPVNFAGNDEGGISVPLFSDLKRHDMGPRLQETLHAASAEENRQFITARLWGIADSGPYLHDGRATTLTEAIDWHGGEASLARSNFFALNDDDKIALLDYLRTLHTPRHLACE